MCSPGAGEGGTAKPDTRIGNQLGGFDRALRADPHANHDGLFVDLGGVGFGGPGAGPVPLE
jgi:hypothetical protein